MYERRVEKQVFYVLPIKSILGKLPVVPVGDTGAIPYSQRRHAKDLWMLHSTARRALETAASGGMSMSEP